MRVPRGLCCLFGLLATGAVSGQALTMSGLVVSSGMHAQVAGGPLQLLPAGTAVPGRIDLSSEVVAGRARHSVQFQYDEHAAVAESDLDVLATRWGGTSASCRGNFRFLLHAGQPLAGVVTITWQPLHWQATAAVQVLVDVGDDGSAELNTGLSWPLQVTVPVAFGPGDLPILAYVQANASTNWFVASSVGMHRLRIEFRPTAPCAVVASGTPCPATGGPELAVMPAFAGSLDFRTSGLLPASQTLGAIVFGTRQNNAVLPLPPQCVLVPDVASWQVLWPDSAGRSELPVDPRPLPRGVPIEVQSLALNLVAGTLAASNLATLTCP